MLSTDKDYANVRHSLFHIHVRNAFFDDVKIKSSYEPRYGTYIYNKFDYKVL